MPISDSFAFKTAQSHLDIFQDDLMHEHKQAMACYDCEDFLLAGVDCYKWLVRAEDSWRRQIIEGIIDHDEKSAAAISDMFTRWLRIGSAQAERMIAAQIAAGYQEAKIANLGEYRKCKAEIEAKLEEQGHLSLAEEARAACSSREEW